MNCLTCTDWLKFDALTELDRLISCVSDELYRMPLESAGDASIGMHTRHVIEYFECLMGGIRRGCIDYSSRPRRTVLEKRRSAARKAIAVLRSSSSNLVLDTPLRVRPAYGNPEGAWTRSSIGRELDALHMHTMHHIALIAVFCRQQGINLHADCGVAPDTLSSRARNHHNVAS